MPTYTPFVKEVSKHPTDPKAWVTKDGGEELQLARSLREIVGDFGGFEFDVPVVDDEYGGEGSPRGLLEGVSVRVSLEAYKGRDLDTTFLAIGYTKQLSKEEQQELMGNAER